MPNQDHQDAEEQDQEQAQEQEAVVTRLLPGALLAVRLDGEAGSADSGGQELTAHVAEELGRSYVSIRPGDRVKIRKSARNSNRAAIVGVIR